MASYLFFILQQALDDLKRNTLRTLLTALTLGLKNYIEAQFQSLGNLNHGCPSGQAGSQPDAD